MHYASPSDQQIAVILLILLVKNYKKSEDLKNAVDFHL